jgi:hypothetical protein
MGAFGIDLATSGDFLLATSADFRMAMDSWGGQGPVRIADFPTRQLGSIATVDQRIFTPS